MWIEADVPMVDAAFCSCCLSPPGWLYLSPLSALSGCLWFVLILSKTCHAVTSLCTGVMDGTEEVPDQTEAWSEDVLLSASGFFLSALCSLVKVFFRVVFFLGRVGVVVVWGFGFCGVGLPGQLGEQAALVLFELELLFAFLIVDHKCALEEEES